MELKVGQIFKDNDPRMSRHVRIAEVYPNGASYIASGGLLRCYPSLGAVVQENIRVRNEEVALLNEGVMRMAEHIKRVEQYAIQCFEALKLAKAWIEYENDCTMEWVLANSAEFMHSFSKPGFNGDYLAACRAVVAALAKTPNPSGRMATELSQESEGPVGLGPLERKEAGIETRVIGTKPADALNEQFLKDVKRDAARYRAFRFIAYVRKDVSFDAYDEEGMDAELDRRIEVEPALAGEALRTDRTVFVDTPLTVQEHGPWNIGTLNGRAGAIYSDDFTHDVVLEIHGDFESEEQRNAYAAEIATRLNAASPRTVPCPHRDSHDGLPCVVCGQTASHSSWPVTNPDRPKP